MVALSTSNAGGPALVTSTRVLITNDDGFRSPGIWSLVRHALSLVNYEVVVAAPMRDSSSSSAAVGPIHSGAEFRYSSTPLPGFSMVPTFAIDGPPGRCVLGAALGAFGRPPEVVISGINSGANTGWFSLLHSGTIGAALTSAGFGIPAIAVSLDVRPDAATQHWESAARLAWSLVPAILRAPPRTVWNLNVPNLPDLDIQDLSYARVGKGGRGRLAIEHVAPGVSRLSRVTTHDVSADPRNEASLLNRGVASLIPIHGPSPDLAVLDTPPVPG